MIESARDTPTTVVEPQASPTGRRGSLFGFSRRQRLLVHACLIGFGFIMLYPLIWMVGSSFTPIHYIFSDPSPWPREFTFQHYVDGWNALPRSFTVFFSNSMLVAIGCVLGNLISCSFAAYAFARLRFRMRKTLFAVMLVTIMLPYHAVMVPQYIAFSSIGLVNTFYPLIIPKMLATDAFFIFLMVQFIRGLPRELDQQSFVDGCGPIRTYWHIILPLMTPALATAAIFTFIWNWNDFLMPLIYLTDTDMFTVPVALSSLLDSETQQGWGPMLAMSVLSLVPIFIFFVAAQKYLVRGIATTGIK